jgi:hypothetical protein
MPSTHRTSYVSEHTVEYYLVPQFRAILEPQFTLILPFYFWANREGRDASPLPENVQGVRLVAVYARRPKISQGRRFLKLNGELFDTAEAFREHGIPVFAGVPDIASLFELATEARFHWFWLKSRRADQEIEMSLGVSNWVSDKSLHGPLDQTQIRAVISAHCKPMLWPHAIDVIKKVRQLMRERPGWWLLSSGYKPVFFALW